MERALVWIISESRYGRIEFMSGRNHSRSGRNASWAKPVLGETRGYHNLHFISYKYSTVVFQSYLVKKEPAVAILKILLFLFPLDIFHIFTDPVNCSC